MQYRELVTHTMNKNLSTEMQFANAGLGLTGEAGEVADLIKKHVAQNHELDRVKLLKELGDVRWYMEYLCILLGTNLAEIEYINTTKLLARYPNGFSTQASVERQA